MQTTKNTARFVCVVLFVFFSFLFDFSPASAATTIGYVELSGDVVWSKAGGPYIVSGVTIPNGASLTIEPGTIVKVAYHISPFSVYGTLTVGAAGAEQTVITSLTDDSFGGDTNNDGSITVPQAGYWDTIAVYGGGVASFVNTTIWYGGYNSYFGNGQVYNEGGNLKIFHCELAYGNESVFLKGGETEIRDNTFRDNYDYGIRLASGKLRFGGNTFLRNGKALHISGTTATFENSGGNSGEGSIYIQSFFFKGENILPADGIPYVFNGNSVPVGAALTIKPGAIIKVFSFAGPLSVQGTLTVGALDAEETIITSITDDTVGGDTNKDGSATIPKKGSWGGISFLNGTGNIINTTIRYGSSNSFGQVSNSGAIVSLDHVKLVEGGTWDIYQQSGTLTVVDSELASTGGGIWVKGGSILIHRSNLHDFTGYGIVSVGPIAVDATNNWWGDASGPWHITHTDGLGVRLNGSVNFDPWLGSDPLLGCTVNCYSNVMFLPGLEASRLYIPNGAADGYQVWEPYEEADAKKLYLNEGGKSINQSVYTKDVIDNAYVLIKGNIYKSFLADLEQWKNTDKLIVDYAAIPYDWRLSLEDVLNNGTKEGENISYNTQAESPYIIQELRRLAGTSKSGKVTLIAHSNGGLVAKALVSKLGVEATELIDKIVFVAVPQSGTPQAIGGLLHGYDQGLPVDWFPFAMAPRTARTLAQNMPSAYNLLPSGAYFSGVGNNTLSPAVTFEDGALTDTFIGKYGKKIDTASELHNFLVDTDNKVAADSDNTASPSRVNSELLLNGENAHQMLDNLVIPASILVYQIAGFGEETLGSVKYWTGEECIREGLKICAVRKPKLEYTPELVTDGDGTVVAPSALAMSTGAANVSRWWVNLGEYNKQNVDRKHASIFEVSELRNFIKENILIQVSSPYPDYVSASEPSIDNTKRLRYFLHSPLALSAHDDAGNEISASISTIPGARYERFGEVQYISLPATSHPTVVLDGLAEGSFTLEAQEVEGETVITTTTFSGIPSSATTQATMDFADGTIADASPLTVDYDGNGATDFSLESKPGETVTFDNTPPITVSSVVGIAGTNDWYVSDITITLTAQDEADGSGIEKIEYSLDNGTTWAAYSIPFVVTQEGMKDILYASTDKQGNKEETRTLSIKIDKTAPEAKIAFNPTIQKLDIIGMDNLSKNVSIQTTEIVIPSKANESHGEKDHEESDRNFNGSRHGDEKSIQVMNTSTLTDEAGHVTILTLSMMKDKERRILRSIESVSYDGVLNLISNTALQYKWNMEKKKSIYSMFASNMKTGSKTIESHYLSKKNITIIMQKPTDLDERDEDSDSETRSIKEKLPGMVVPGFLTEKGIVKIIY